MTLFLTILTSLALGVLASLQIALYLTPRSRGALWGNARAFAAKCVRNVANAGVFSSDRTILEYARDIWHV